MREGGGGDSWCPSHSCLSLVPQSQDALWILLMAQSAVARCQTVFSEVVGADPDLESSFDGWGVEGASPGYLRDTPVFSRKRLPKILGY